LAFANKVLFIIVIHSIIADPSSSGHRYVVYVGNVVAPIINTANAATMTIYLVFMLVKEERVLFI
jgi:hypothetical protein